MHSLCASKLLGRVDRYDKHRDLRVQKKWDIKGRTKAVALVWMAAKKQIEADHTVWSALHCLMEGVITGRAHSPYHTCPLSAPHWIIPEGRICTPSIIYSITRTHLCCSLSFSHKKQRERAREMEGGRQRSYFMLPRENASQKIVETSRKSRCWCTRVGSSAKRRL